MRHFTVLTVWPVVRCGNSKKQMCWCALNRNHLLLVAKMQLNVVPGDLKVGPCKIMRFIDNDRQCREIYQLTVTTENTKLLYLLVLLNRAHAWLVLPYNQYTETCCQ